MRRVAAIILNYRNAPDTVACVDHLLRIDRPLDIVVLDNASGDGSVESIATGIEALRAQGADAPPLLRASPAPAAAPWPQGQERAILLVETGRNGGYAFGNNMGMALALQRPETAFVWILNNDTIVPDAATLDALIARMDEDPTIGICGATVAYAERPDLVQTLGGCSFDYRLGRGSPIGAGTSRIATVDRGAVEARLAYVNGAAAFVRRSFLEDVGPMPEHYFLYWEEIAWARQAGSRWRLGYAPDALVFHRVGGTIGTDGIGGNSPLAAFYLTRNRFRFLLRHAPLALPFALAETLREIARELARGRRATALATARALLGYSTPAHQKRRG